MRASASAFSCRNFEFPDCFVHAFSTLRHEAPALGRASLSCFSSFGTAMFAARPAASQARTPLLQRDPLPAPEPASALGAWTRRRFFALALRHSLSLLLSEANAAASLEFVLRSVGNLVACPAKAVPRDFVSHCTFRTATDKSRRSDRVWRLTQSGSRNSGDVAELKRQSAAQKTATGGNMVSVNVNGRERTFDGDPDRCRSCGISATSSTYRHQIRLRRRALRSLHRPRQRSRRRAACGMPEGRRR